MSKIKFYDIFLPVGEKGDDFNFHLDLCKGNTEHALESMAEYYEFAAITCRQFAELAKEHPEIEFYGDEHIMHLDWPEDNEVIASKINQFIKDGDIEVVELDDDETDENNLN